MHRAGRRIPSIAQPRRRTSCRAWTCSEQHGSGDPPAARPSRTWTRSCDEQHGLDNPQARIEGGETQDCPVCVKNLELRGAWRVGEGADLRLCEGFGGAAVRRRCKTPDGGSSASPQLRILNRNSEFPCSGPPLSPQFRILNRVRLRPLAGRPSGCLSGQGGSACRGLRLSRRGRAWLLQSSKRKATEAYHVLGRFPSFSRVVDLALPISSACLSIRIQTSFSVWLSVRLRSQSRLRLQFRFRLRSQSRLRSRF